MAFVYRSELKSVLVVNAHPDLGPGYYHKEEKQNDKNYRNKIPFLSSSERTKNKKIQEVPGPGAYYNDEQFAKIYKNAFNNNLISGNNIKITGDDKNTNINVDVIYRALENENIVDDADPIHLFIDEHFEKLGFLSKNKRFKEIKNIEVPGPGTYLRTISKSAKNINKINDKEKLKKIYLASLNKQRIESIPGKNHAFGYDLDEEGNLKPNDDPLKDKKFMGAKGSSVGPGNYELAKEKDWVKKGALSWGKTKSHKLNNFLKRDIKNKNILNKSVSPEGKLGKFFINSGSNFHNANSNKGNINTNENFDILDMKNNNRSIADAKYLSTDGKNLNVNIQNKTFYAANRSKQLNNFGYRKYSAGFRKKFNFETEENKTNENQNVYDKNNLRAFKKINRLSQSFEHEKKEANYIKTETDTMIKFFKQKNKKRKEILLMNHTNKLFDRSYLLQNKKVDNNPEPGYYLEEKIYTSFNSQPTFTGRTTNIRLDQSKISIFKNN